MVTTDWKNGQDLASVLKLGKQLSIILLPSSWPWSQWYIIAVISLSLFVITAMVFNSCLHNFLFIILSLLLYIITHDILG